MHYRVLIFVRHGKIHEQLQTRCLPGTGHGGVMPITRIVSTPTDRLCHAGKPMVLGPGLGTRRSSSSSRFPGLSLQISPTRNPTSNANTKHPRDPPQPIRQHYAKVDPPPRLFQPIEHPRRQRLSGFSVRVFDFEWRVDIRDGVRDGSKARCEPVLVEAIA